MELPRESLDLMDGVLTGRHKEGVERLDIHWTQLGRGSVVLIVVT